MATTNSCRLCLTMSDDHLNVFSVIGIELNLCAIISEHFKCEVSDTDPLPNFVCQTCWATTKTFHELYQRSKKVQETFLNQRIKIEYDTNELWLENIERETPEQCISEFKDEPYLEFATTFDEQMTYDDSYETSYAGSNGNLKDGSELSQNNESAGGDEEASKPYIKRKRVAKQRKSDFEQLFSENKHRFDMSCDSCPTLFDTLDEARNHYATLHNNSKGYIKCCNVKLIYRCKVIKHLYRHLDPEKFKCDECGKTYMALHVLKAHKKSHKRDPYAEKELVECDICKKAFTSKLYLKKHIQCHTDKSEDEQYRKFITDNFDMNCDQCDVVFTTFYDARRHYRDLHNEKKGYIKCCDTKLNEFWLVVDHINSHLNPQVYSCELCSKTYADRKKFYLHKRRHKQAIAEPFICDYCGKAFRNKETITRHLFNNHVQSEPKFECETCHKRFQLLSLLRNHYYSVHREKKANVTCEFCGKSFNVKANFDKHMVSHVEKSERLAQRKQCEHCGEWLMTKSGIYYHEQIHTSGVRKCDQCQLELPHKLALLAHIRKYHRKPKHKCHFCEKTFEIGSKLREHEEGHTRHNVYPCEYCSKVFTVQSSRQTHVRRNHRDELEQRKQMRKALLLPP